jgi:hypothetical protein
MASDQNQITIRELWIQLRGIENAFRFYSDALNAVASIKGNSYETRTTVDVDTHGILSNGFIIDCINFPWCHIKPHRIAATFGALAKRVVAMDKALQTLISSLPVDEEIGFYFSEMPGIQSKGEPSPTRN